MDVNCILPRRGKLQRVSTVTGHRPKKQKRGLAKSEPRLRWSALKGTCSGWALSDALWGAWFLERAGTEGPKQVLSVRAGIGGTEW
jgi:hypothetical protein